MGRVNEQSEAHEAASVCAIAELGATKQSATAGTVKKARWQRDGLPLVMA
ncbi:MAG TPA: hypothetical protein VJQ55_09015 [Candidatus Binatia bacterium]|nr:hypothetical protein [Candidatus Binatia bacterium]